MARPRRTPDPEPEEAPEANGEWGGEMVKIKYVGPDRQECLPVTQFTGERFMENGKSYEVPSELAESLAASSSSWQGKEE